MDLLSKTKVDRLGERLRKGISEEDLRLLDAHRQSFGEAYEAVLDAVRTHARRDPSGRSKSTASIVAKLRRESLRLSQMQDIAGCRVVVEGIREQDDVRDALAVGFVASTIVDRRIDPSYGYRAIHIVATNLQKPVEIQVRTELQHLWAQYSERCAFVIDPELKYGRGSPALRAHLMAMSLLVADVEALEVSERPTAAVSERLASMKEQIREALLKRLDALSSPDEEV